MGMLERYKKRGGFLQLLILLETTGKEKQDKFMKMIAEENPTWEAEIRKKMLSMDRMLGWNQSYLAEVVNRVPPINVAMIAHSLSPEKKNFLVQSLNFKERKKVEDIMAEKQPSAGEISVSIVKFFEETRRMMQEGSLKMDKVDPELVIPENIEEQLESGRSQLVLKEIQETIQATGSQQPNEEVLLLRRKVVALTTENQKLLAENQAMKEKLEHIRKIS